MGKKIATFSRILSKQEIECEKTSCSPLGEALDRADSEYRDLKVKKRRI